MNSTRVTFGTLALALLIVLYPTRGATQSSGKTANGCAYEVVNGKYYYNCPEAKAADVGRRFGIIRGGTICTGPQRLRREVRERSTARRIDSPVGTI